MENLELELIEAYTNENYHTEALMIKAISQGRFVLLKDIAEIAIKQIEDGYLNEENYKKRREIEKKLA